MGGEKLSEGTVHVQRCQISAPVAGHLAMPLTERKVQWIMAETPLLRAKSGWGAEEAYHNQSEWTWCKKAYWEVTFDLSPVISFEIANNKGIWDFDICQKGAWMKILETLCYGATEAQDFMRHVTAEAQGLTAFLCQLEVRKGLIPGAGPLPVHPYTFTFNSFHWDVMHTPCNLPI